GALCSIFIPRPAGLPPAGRLLCAALVGRRWSRLSAAASRRSQASTAVEFCCETQPPGSCRNARACQRTQESSMSTRHPLGWAGAGALAAAAASGARAVEATQWDPQAGPTTTVAANTDALREPGAWTVARGEATEFHDGVARDTMSTRGEVRHDLAQAK